MVLCWENKRILENLLLMFIDSIIVLFFFLRHEKISPEGSKFGML